MQQPRDNRTIGLVGVGLVGTALAERLLTNGFDVVGYDIEGERLEHLQSLGGQSAGSAADVAGVVDCVFLSLPDTTVVGQAVNGPGGLLAAEKLPSYVIDTTTGDPDGTVAVAEQLKERGVSFLDATISGSSSQLGKGQAMLMVGGERAAFDACASLLRVLSERVFYVGPSGSGSKAKLATNLVLGLNRVALAEGLVFAETLGIDLEAFLELLRAGPAYSAAVQIKGEKMVRGDFAAESRIEQHRKDVVLILKYAKNSGQELPLSRVHLDVLDKAIAAGDGRLDTSAVIREIRRRSLRAAEHRWEGSL